jgi:sterol desaturase/sphingolipid hydroxylase (fatty acid hydroxylase superfamily)
VKATQEAGPLRLTLGLVVLICVFLILAWMGVAAMVCANRLWAGAPLDWSIMRIVPTTYTDLAVLPIMASFLAIDRFTHGPEKYSLCQLSGRIRYDLFFVLTYATGAGRALQLGFTFGLVNWVESLVSPVGVFRPLGEMAFWAQIPLIYFIVTFGIYWIHRFMHTRLMWPLHAFHHAATDMTALTDARVHPIDDALEPIPVFVSAAVLGFAPDAVLIVGLLGRVHFALTHSSVPFPIWLERWVISGPRVHRVHHALADEHFNRNFSLLVLWDRLFGTYSLPTNARALATGVADSRFNTGRPWLDMFAVTRIWLVGLKDEGARWLRKSPATTNIWQALVRERR